MNRTERIAELFRAQPNEWISVYALMPEGGAMAWRTRVSECRTLLKMQIDCKVERDRNGVAVSYYKFVPQTGQGALPLKGAA